MLISACPMFLRTKTSTSSGKTRVQIVKSVHSGTRVTERVVRHVGTADSDEQLRQLRVLGETMIEDLRKASPRQSVLTPKPYAELYEHSQAALLAAGDAKKPMLSGVNLEGCRETARVNVGIREAMSELYHQFGWDRLLGARRMSDNRMLKELVLARLEQSLPEPATVRELKEHDDVVLNLDRVYQTMDCLDEPLIDRIRQQSLEAARTLYDEPVSVVFYGTTTLSFTSERGADELDNEQEATPHRVQVMLALLLNADGIPVGYELFPGKTVAGTTLVTAIGQLQKNHPGVRFTLVADTGMISADNEALLRDRGIPYLLGLGAQPRAQEAGIRQWILDKEGFLPWEGTKSPPPKRKPKSGVHYKVRAVDGAQLIVTHCRRRAGQDAGLRGRQITRLMKQLEKSGIPASPSTSGPARFLSFPDGRVELNEDRIAEAARWDGLRGIRAWGLEDQDPQSLILQYRRPWRIGDHFRTNKHDLQVRPIFHWKPQRIRAHIAICYMAFCCLQHLRHQLTVTGGPMSPYEIRRALNGLQFSILTQQNTRKQFAMPSKATAEARHIYHCLGLKWNETPFPVPARTWKTRNPKPKPSS